MEINIFLLCYNESVILPHTIHHYKRHLPSCKITIYDNESTDNSSEIAKSLGCNIISWNSNNIIDDYKYIDLKNNCWKDVKSGWIIMADMDEWLTITENELIDEMKNETSIINVKGLDIIGESNTIDLSDIDLQTINRFVYNDYESKKLCFLREKINEINYSLGAHGCDPVGDIKYSSTIYYNKHMCNLGLNFLINKMINRYKRSEEMRSQGKAIHYTDNIDNITIAFNKLLSESIEMDLFINPDPLLGEKSITE